MFDPRLNSDRRPAAVLLLVYPRAGEYYTVFTKRTDRVGSHKGEVSLPGGAWEPDDRSLALTALREAREELGVDSSVISVLAELEPVLTRGSNFRITPFVAYTEISPVFTAQAEEVDVVIELPIARIAHPDVIRREPMLIRGELQVVTYFVYGGHRIWGATARILQSFHERLTGGGLALPDGRPLLEVVLPPVLRSDAHRR